MLVGQFAELYPDFKLARNWNEASFFTIILHVPKHDHILFETCTADSEHSVSVVSPKLIILIFLLALDHAFGNAIHHNRIAKTNHTVVENATDFILTGS